MTSQLAWDQHEGVIALIVAVVIIGMGLVTMTNPELQPLSIVIVGVVIGTALLIPYVPGIDTGHPPTSVAGVLIASVGIYGLLTDNGAATLMWLFVLGGIGMAIEDRIRRRR